MLFVTGSSLYNNYGSWRFVRLLGTRLVPEAVPRFWKGTRKELQDCEVDVQRFLDEESWSLQSYAVVE